MGNNLKDESIMALLKSEEQRLLCYYERIGDSLHRNAPGDLGFKDCPRPLRVLFS